MDRKDFLTNISLLGLFGLLSPEVRSFFPEDDESSFARKLKPLGRVLELEDSYVWCNSPVMGEDGKVHVFFSRWNSRKGMGGWINGCSIWQAVAGKPEGPYEVTRPVLEPRAGKWDATTCHNPLIKKVDDTWCLFYMGNSNGKTNTKRIGLATAASLDGPWNQPEEFLLDAGPEGAWDDHCTTNPAFLKHSNGQCWLYYKSWNTRDYETGSGTVRGNRKYGLAISDRLQGPYRKFEGNPVIDFSHLGNNTQFEDAFIWKEKNKFRLIARDMGIYNHVNGIIMESRDGKSWSAPRIAYYGTEKYLTQPPAPPHLKKYGRFERPQVLLINGKPSYLFTTSQGGKYMTASPFVFRIKG